MGHLRAKTTTIRGEQRSSSN